jgi:hypothetical protein
MVLLEDGSILANDGESVGSVNPVVVLPAIAGSLAVTVGGGVKPLVRLLDPT